MKLSHKKINTLTKILAKDIYQTLYQGKYIDGKYAYERILHFICHQGKQVKTMSIWSNRNSHSLLVGMIRYSYFGREFSSFL